MFRLSKPAWAVLGVVVALLAAPRECAAEDHDEGPTLISYGLSGFWLGAEDGLAAGYLSTGRTFESHEWRNLVVGAGIGALVGVGAGLLLSIPDTATDTHPGTGWYVLRDGGYGATLGALVGLAIGAISLADNGSTKELVVGAAIGALAGTGVGFVFGVIEGLARGKHKHASADDEAARERGMQLAFTLIPWRNPRGAPSLLPGLHGNFQ